LLEEVVCVARVGTEEEALEVLVDEPAGGRTWVVLVGLGREEEGREGEYRQIP
jgi:hypothetical protein